MPDTNEPKTPKDSKPNPEKFVPPESVEPDSLSDSKTNQAVESIERQEGDDLLAAEDSKHVDTIKKPWYKKFFGNKKLWIPSLIALIIIIIFVVPWSRYKLLGLFIKRNYVVQITDSQTGKPISDVMVNMDGKTALTNNQGKVTLNVKVGSANLTIVKKYYTGTTEKAFVGLRSSGYHSYKLQATGRQVPLTIVNKISGKPIAKATIIAADTKAETDADGKVTMVLPANKSQVPATISGTGYNSLQANITVTTSVVPANAFQLTPSGKVYFLSNASGNIDVVSANLDGSNRKTILAGTGREDPTNTILLASRDWKYLALLSKRDGGPNAKLFLISTNNNQLNTIEGGAATFTPVGWDGHSFIYQADQTNVKQWQSGQSSMLSYNADTSKINTLDQTSGSGSSSDNYTSQDFGYNNTYIVGNNVIYIKEWSQGYAADPAQLNGKQDQIISIAADGSGKQVLKSLAVPKDSGYQDISSVAYKPQVIYYQVQNGSGNTYYSYSNGIVSQNNTITDTSFQQYSNAHTTYLLSPTGDQTFWDEQRDGKNTLFIGNSSGDNGKIIANLSDYSPYGWYTDNYLLVQKSGSELYVMPVNGGKVIKISDYYKPPKNFYGYGGGYGGL